jgi:hypothetical protein
MATTIADLPADVVGVLAHFVGNEHFALTPEHLARPSESMIVMLDIHDQVKAKTSQMTIDWATVTAATFDPNLFYYERMVRGADNKWEESQIEPLYRRYRRVCRDLTAFSAVCRQWNRCLEPMWKAVFLCMEKFIPFVFGRKKDFDRRQLVSRPNAASLLAPLDVAWYRLALKYVCKDGKKLAKQTITLHKVQVDSDKKKKTKTNKRGLKPKTLYLVRNKVTGKVAVSRGHMVLQEVETVEHRLVEKYVNGRAYWLHATVAQVEEAVQRRRQILADTRALEKELKGGRRSKSKI